MQRNDCYDAELLEVVDGGTVLLRVVLGFGVSVVLERHIHGFPRFDRKSRNRVRQDEHVRSVERLFEALTGHLLRIQEVNQHEIRLWHYSDGWWDVAEEFK